LKIISYIYLTVIDTNIILSIIIPSYNNSDIFDRNAPLLIDFLKKTALRYEIILVDDGSNKDTNGKRIAEKYGCDYIKYSKNMGKGFAVRTGMLRAKGDIKIFTDTDIPFELDALQSIINYFTKKDYDVVIGDRTLTNSTYFNEISFFRKFGSSIFTFFVGRFVTTGMNDTQCGLKGFKKEVADDLFSHSKINGFAFDVEIIYISLKRNYDIKRIPVQLRNTEGNSVSLFKHSFKMLLDIFLIKLYHIQGKYTKKNESKHN
jgi:dolichyl-phosphate beta-glucosyltransferase